MEAGKERNEVNKRRGAAAGRHMLLNVSSLKREALWPGIITDFTVRYLNGTRPSIRV